MSAQDGTTDGTGFTGTMHLASPTFMTLLVLATWAVSAGMQGSSAGTAGSVDMEGSVAVTEDSVAGMEEEDTVAADRGAPVVAVHLEVSWTGWERPVVKALSGSG